MEELFNKEVQVSKQKTMTTKQLELIKQNKVVPTDKGAYDMKITSDFRVECVTELTPQWCLANNIDTLLLDVDGTLMPEDSDNIKKKIMAWIEELKEEGINLCLISNASEKRVRKVAKKLEIPYVAEAHKPSSLGIRYAICTWKYDPKGVVMVGNSMDEDIVAGHCAGVRTVKVKEVK